MRNVTYGRDVYAYAFWEYVGGMLGEEFSDYAVEVEEAGASVGFAEEGEWCVGGEGSWAFPFAEVCGYKVRFLEECVVGW